jgi:hypothetical protein
MRGNPFPPLALAFVLGLGTGYRIGLDTDDLLAPVHCPSCPSRAPDRLSENWNKTLDPNVPWWDKPTHPHGPTLPDPTPGGGRKPDINDRLD